MKITITITDNPGGKSCDVQIHFDPPYHKGDTVTPAVRAAIVAFSAIEGEASQMKAKTIITKDRKEGE